MMERAYVAIKRETGDFLVMTSPVNEEALCLFWGVEDAERTLISWGHDPDYWRIVGGDNVWTLINNLEHALEHGLKYFTANPPIVKGHTMKVLQIESLLEYCKGLLYEHRGASPE